ncbi:MAG: hypothetical protein QY325_02865 [Flavobacteriales bacterium]|nr:MAG: hypothetical protein QY325_02865 [Flavobacteriales bacterium]
MKRWMWYAVFLTVGAGAGWAYWNWYGCIDGCAITGRWWTSSAYGAIMGYLLVGMVLPQRRASQGPGDAKP